MNARESAPPVRGVPITRSALYQEVAERLRARIFAHECEAGSWLDEQALAAEFGISRTPLREALKVLAAEGLVRLEPRRGCYVAQLSERDLDDIFAALALLEGRCAALAAVQAANADLVHLDDIHARLEACAAAGDTDGFFEANHAFHEAIQALAGNRWLKHLIDDTRKLLRLTRRDSLNLDGRVRQSLGEHRAILAALRKREGDEAGRLMHDHLLSGRAALARLYRPDT